MTANEKRLAKVFFATVFFVAVGITAFTGIERIQTAETSIDSYAKALAKLPRGVSDANEIEAKISTMKDAIERLPTSAEPGPFSDFAKEVRTTLARYRIDPAQYQVVGSAGEEALELSLRCETAAFLKFLKDASNEKRGWDIPFLAIRPLVEGNTSDITIRVKYAK